MQPQILDPDRYGRTVTLTTEDDLDIYTVTDNDVVVLTATFPAGWPQWRAYYSIEAWAPSESLLSE